MYAAREGHLDMLQLLLQYGMPAAEVMCGVTTTCCIGACDWGLSNALMDLMCCDCNLYAITQTAYDQLTALHSAALGNQAACITALLQHSAGTGAQAGADQSHSVS